MDQKQQENKIYKLQKKNWARLMQHGKTIKHDTNNLKCKDPDPLFPQLALINYA